MAAATVKKGDKIKVDYVGTLEDGTIFDSTEKQGTPLEFEVGSGQLIKGFDTAVVGMSVGEEKKIILKPADAYGEHNSQLFKEVPREQLPKDREPEAGMMLAISLPNGARFPARITDVNEKTITLDLNHPLAGKTLKFTITVREIIA